MIIMMIIMMIIIIIIIIIINKYIFATPKTKNKSTIKKK